MAVDRGLRRGATLALVAALCFGAASHAAPPVGVDMSCFAPAGDPAPGTPAWYERDAHNQYCASLRNRDQLLSPAFGLREMTTGATLYTEQTGDQVGDPTHPRGGITTLVPGAKGADPYRSIKRWTELGLGRVVPISFKTLDGATLRGHVFEPPARARRPHAGYPGVVITDGSVQAYEELYFWAAEDLVSKGYMVMTYDVQGQGDSDLFPASCTPQSCPGVPYQQNYNFFQGAEDSLGFFLSRANPMRDDLDASRVGIAGHSLGAAAVSEVGQCDTRVKTIVAWDDLQAITGCGDITVPKAYQAPKGELIRVPALALTNDYLFNTQTASTPPDPHSKDAGYQQLVKAGQDSEIIAFRGATHLTYTYIPLVFQASELDERMASYYTAAWFDYYLRHRASGYRRLVATKFDGSADVDSIGAGVYDPTAVDPTDPYSGNVPYTIKGIPVANAASFYYLSEYSLTAPGGARATCADVRKGC